MLWDARHFMGRDAGERSRSASTSQDSDMAMGGTGGDAGGVAPRRRPHAKTMTDLLTPSALRTPRGFMRRMGSRSLNEEQSRVSTYSDGSTSSTDGSRQRNSLPERMSPTNDASMETKTLARHGTDPHLNDRYYASLVDMGNYVKMGWLTKQGHVWKNWKNRFFVLFHDGTLAYYKAKGKRRMKGCMKLNEGVVSVQHVDICRSGKAYVFQVEKGYYRMWCCCCSQLEAELWVNALRKVRQCSPPCFEPLLTVHEEQFGCLAVNRQLNKIFVTDNRIQSMMAAFKASIVPHSVGMVYEFIERLEAAIMDRYQGYLYADPEVELLSGNELVKLMRRHVEDRAFIPVASRVYSSLDTSQLRTSRSHIAKHLKLLKTKAQRELGVPDDVADMSTDWAEARSIIDSLDCMSLPSHKIDLIINAGGSISARIARRHGALAEVADRSMSAIFRYVLVHSSVDDLASLRALLKPIYEQHPACQNQSDVVAAFLDAIGWIDSYHSSEDASAMDGVSIASSRVVVSISTTDVGILFTTDGNGRGAIVHSVRKLSQAALSEVIVPGLSLIAINDEPVVLMSFRDIILRIRSASLPKKLTFMPEFFYYQMLSLDSEMYQYLLCLAASRGDKDSVSWLIGSQLDVNEPCAWQNSRGAQMLGFKPPIVSEFPLHAATQMGHSVMIEYLLRLGAHPNLEDRFGRTPLHVLSSSTLDMVSIVEELQNAGAKLNARDREGLTPLMAMAQRGSMEGVTTLLALGGDLSAVAWSTGFTALEYAVYAGSLEIVELLLSKNADLSHTALDGDTALHIASADADVDLVQMLVNAGADVNIQNRFGQTPAAVLLAHSPIGETSDDVRACVDILARAGCNVAQPDLFGRHLLHLAQLANDDSIYRRIRLFFKPEDADRDQFVDIFGCTARDYSLDNLTGNDMAHLRVRDPCLMWGRSGKSHHHHNVHAAQHSRSKSFDEMIHTLLHDVSVDLADLVSFVVFLETFGSLDAVMSQLREYVSNGSKGRNILRFLVVLMVFKLRHVSDGDPILSEIRELLERHRRLMSYKAFVMMDDYKRMFEQLFSLRGSATCLELYASTPISMQQRYGLQQQETFTALFPRNLIIQVEPSQWAEHCTLLTHTLFCSIPVEDFAAVGSKALPSRQFLSAKRWFQHLTAYVINAVLVEDTREGRAEVVKFFLSAAECCLSLRNFDTLAAILYALQSTPVQRLRHTLDWLSVSSKKLLNQMQRLSDKGCREVNKIMHGADNPSMPYIGLYLQGFVGLNELPVFDQGELVNGNRLRKMGELVVEILRRRSVAYDLRFHQDVEAILHVELPYPTDESRYSRSLQLEPREAGAVPLGERSTYVDTDVRDIDGEVRESIGSEGTFGIRQWFRMQKVVHRNRSRSATQPACYEWV